MQSPSTTDPGLAPSLGLGEQDPRPAPRAHSPRVPAHSRAQMPSLIVLCGYATPTRGSPRLGRLYLPGWVLRGWRGGRIRLLRKVSLLGRSPLPHPQPLPGATGLEGGKLRATVPPTCGQRVGPASGAASGLAVSPPEVRAEATSESAGLTPFSRRETGWRQVICPAPRRVP